MKKILSCFSIAAFAAAVLFSVPAARASATPISAQPSAPPAYGQEPWANAPSEYRGAERQGFRDGIEGARKDAENHRPPNVNNRDEFRNPPVSRRDRRAYREGFQRGYQVGVQHLMNRGAVPVAPAQAYGPEPWANAPSEWNEVERRGFHDGVEGARKDADNHRPPNVNNRDEYRDPPVPHRDRRAYRQGFQRGYQVGVQHLMRYYHGH